MATRSKTTLPPAIPLTIKKNNTAGPSRKSKDKYSGLSNDELMSMIAHTPPSFTPGSLELPLTKRTRSGSISGRLRSASDLEERGVIDRYQKGVLKDLIISGNAELQDALEKFENGDSSALESLMDSGLLDQRKSSFDLLDDLDFGFLNVGELHNSPRDDDEQPFGEPAPESLDDWDDMKFETAFADITSKSTFSGLSSVYDSGIADSFANSLPSMGMGITPPNPFGLSEQFLDPKDPEKKIDEASYHHNKDKSSRPIGIPGSSKDSLTPKIFVGAYSPESRRKRIDKFLEKRQNRVWTKKVKYDVRKNFADSRLRVKGRFVKKEDEQLLRELLALT